jgi:hypothetical protein
LLSLYFSASLCSFSPERNGCDKRHKKKKKKELKKAYFIIPTAEKPRALSYFKYFNHLTWEIKLYFKTRFFTAAFAVQTVG